MSISEKITVIEVIEKEFDMNDVLKPSDSTSRYNFENVKHNYDNITKTFNIFIKRDSIPERENERNTEFGITALWFLALDALGSSSYPASVVFASASVESAINHDTRLKDLRDESHIDWITLSWKNLEYAFCKGLPVKLLMNQSDKFEKNGIEFVERRNLVAHGDFIGYEKYDHNKPVNNKPHHFESVYFPTQQHALEQIEKAKNFLMAWAKDPNLVLYQDGS